MRIEKKAQRINQYWQLCINVMRVDVINMNELDINKHRCKLRVKCLENSTALILVRWQQAKKDSN